MPYPDFVLPEPIDRAFARIAQAVSERRVDFLFGAGMSAESDVPAGGQLASKLLRHFFPASGTNPPSDDKLSELTQYVPFEALVEAVQQRSEERRVGKECRYRW